MPQARKVLLADPDLAAARALTRALRAKGYQVQYAPDGSKALEVAVLRHPDVVLFDEACTLIEAASFVSILQTNPRTEDIPVVVTTTSNDLDRLRRFREGILKKPFNLDEVLARIDHLCRRSEAAKELRGDAREIEGSLTQLPLADLLQILAMNKRTGKLTLSNGQQRGEISISLGRPVNARLGDVDGEKALFRLIGWREGSFAFVPGPPPGRPRIDRTMEDALLEGMRQADERARLMGGLPPLGQLLALVPDGAMPVDPHPVTKEVLRVLAQPRRLSEVLDLADATDLDILGAVTTLLQKGVIQQHQGAVTAEGPLLGAAEVHALRARLMRGKPARNALVAKIVLCGSGPSAARWFARTQPGLVLSSSDPACLRSSFGTLGRLDVSDVLKVDFVMVPVSEAARPLWRPFLATALGALVMEDNEAVLKLARFCAFELRLPLVVAARNASGGLITSELVPPQLRNAPGGATVVGSDLNTAVRTLLLAAVKPPTSEVPESVMTPAPAARPASRLVSERF
jgi:DNA-binding response OmpR family regulator